MNKLTSEQVDDIIECMCYKTISEAAEWFEGYLKLSIPNERAKALVGIRDKMQDIKLAIEKALDHAEEDDVILPLDELMGDANLTAAINPIPLAAAFLGFFWLLFDFWCSASAFSVALESTTMEMRLFCGSLGSLPSRGMESA